ncbi:MAG: 50S ribosomal protein L9 [Chloroflexota bacterium]
MKIILLADVYNHGVAGEVVDVAPGFARNFLIPKGMATKATKSELKRFEKIREKAEARRMEYEGMLNELGRKIDGTNLMFFRRAASTGKLFGSVTTQEITEELDRITGIDINRRRISQQGLRDTGLHEVSVRLGTDVSPVLFIRVLPEDQRLEYERQREAIESGELGEIRFDDKGYIVPVDLLKLRRKAEKEAEEAEAAEAIAAAAEAEAIEEETVAADEDIPPASDYSEEDEA